MGKKRSAKQAPQGANLGFEAKLWLAADKLRNNRDAAEYKRVVLGLIFQKHISDAFEEVHARLAAGEGSPPAPTPRRRTSTSPQTASGSARRPAGPSCKPMPSSPTIGNLIDDGMVAIERDNPRLNGILPKDFAHPALDKQRLVISSASGRSAKIASPASSRNIG